MAKYNTAVTAFSAGELSPKLRSRTDINEYGFGLEEMLNFVPYKSGGAVRRPGSRFVADFSAILGTPGAEPPGLYPFVFSQEEAYLIVMKPGEAIANAISVYDRQGNEISATFLPTTVSTFTYPVPDFPSTLDATKFQYAQSGDRIYFVHSSGFIPPIVLQRKSEDTFEFFHYLDIGGRTGLGVPWQSANTSSTSFYVSSATGGTAYKTITPEIETLNSDTAYFTSDMVGMYVRLTDESVQRETIGVISSFTSSTQVQCLFFLGVGTGLVGAGNKTSNWRISSWNGVDGYPRTVSFYEQRLLFGGTTKEPDTIWTSEIGNFTRFMYDRLDQDISSDFSNIGTSGPLLASDAFTFTIASTEVNAIRWMSVEEVLMVGTSGSEYIIQPIDALFSRNNITVKPRSSFGSSDVQAFKAGRGVIHISRDGRRVRRFTFADANGRTDNVDITTLSSDIVYFNPGSSTSSTQFKGVKIQQMAWQDSRATMWMITTRKALLGVTIDPSTNTVAFHKHNFGGAESASGMAQVLGIVSLPNEDNSYEDLWILVRRTVGLGFTTVDYLEKLGDDFEADELFNTSEAENDKPYFSDSSIKFTKAEAEVAATVEEAEIDIPTDLMDIGERHNFHQAQEVVLNGPVGNAPTGLPYGTYYVIPTTLTGFKLASSVANAQGGTAVDITALPGVSAQYTVTPVAISGIQVVSGLNHLSGQDISIVGDGQYIGDFTLAGNDPLNAGFNLDLGAEYSELIIGLKYKSRLKTMPLEAGQQFGASRGNITRIDRLSVLLYKSWTGKTGVDSEEDGEILYDIEDIGNESFTGDAKVDFPQSPDRLGQVVVETEEPLPLSVLGLRMRGVAYDG